MEVGSQNVYDSTFPNGPNTGATTCRMLREIGCQWVLLGHSDRRNNLGETDELIAAKAAQVLEQGLNLCLTLGETKAQRDADETDAVIMKQLSTVASKIPVDAWNRVALAYEPVWAVGEGASPCPPTEAQRTHRVLRIWLETHVSPQAAKACRITYTGSVNETNATSYAALDQVDGFVVGRAGLDATKLTSILKTLVQAKQTSLL
jgi:triosephosphate isomerase